MKTPKNYFHDKIVLLFLSVSAFVAALSSLYLMLRVNFGEPYIVEYRSELARQPFIRGDASTFWQFVVFAFLILAVHWAVSIKMYQRRRHFAYIILFLGLVLLIFNAVVSNALIGSPI